jgi:hypothetical protein
MPKGFYYLIASLPFLEMKKDLQISVDSFVEEAEKWLSPKEHARLMGSSIVTEEENIEREDIVSRWQSFDGKLRIQFKKIREKKAEGLAIGKPDKEIESIMREQDPLQREIMLAQKKITFLEDREQGHDFDLEAVIIYYLKLVIIQRIQSFDKEKGQQVFLHLCEVKYEQN